MNQGQRFNPINQVPFSGPYAQPYPLPFNYGAPQPYPLKQHFNHGVPQPFGVPQQFYNHPTNNDRSWIDKAVAYRAFTQNQQAPQLYNQQRIPQIQVRFANYPILNQQAPQPYNQHQVQANYQRDQLTHAPYSLAPFGQPNSVNQHPFNYPRGAINPPQAFNARAQSNQHSSTPNDSRNFQPVSIYHNPVSYGHQIKPSFSPVYNQGFVAQRIPIQPYYAQPHAKPYAQNGIQSVDSLFRQGYTVENQSKGEMVPLSDQVNVERMAAKISNQSSERQIWHEEYIAELEKQKKEVEKHNEKYTKTIKQLETTVNEARAITDQTNQSSTSWPYSAESLDYKIERHVPSSSLDLSYKEVFQLCQAPLRVIGEGKPEKYEDLRRQKPLQTQKPSQTQIISIGSWRA